MAEVLPFGYAHLTELLLSDVPGLGFAKLHAPFPALSIVALAANPMMAYHREAGSIVVSYHSMYRPCVWVPCYLALFDFLKSPFNLPSTIMLI